MKALNLACLISITYHGVNGFLHNASVVIYNSLLSRSRQEASREVLQAATRMLAGVALRSLDAAPAPAPDRFQQTGAARIELHHCGLPGMATYRLRQILSSSRSRLR